MGDGRIVGGGKEEGEVRGLELAHGAVRVEVEGDAECFEDVSGPGLGGHGAVAVLDHPHSPSGSDKRRPGGDVDRIGAIAARPRGVHDACPSDGERPAGGDEGSGGPGDIGKGLAAGADVGQQGRDVNVVVLPHRQRREYFQGLFEGGFGDVEVGLESGERIAGVNLRCH